MTRLNNLAYALQQMILELSVNGNNESAAFFQTHYDMIIKSGYTISGEELETLSTCMSMSQYANFSHRETQLLDNIVNNAIEIKIRMHNNS
ncbi:hypothetical protein LDK53_19640 [Enterobacter sp. K16B]|uniref:hypothetical protein n=1 Tax=Enterobacter sp. K16B TaxID=2878537 RepID=UPI001CD9C28B|nr:hypothetical protein [Enterobacter sp. K16B]MCA2028161.1 hypothetical protein [Enterobacter sp. K16B]